MIHIDHTQCGQDRTRDESQGRRRVVALIVEGKGIERRVGLGHADVVEQVRRVEVDPLERERYERWAGLVRGHEGRQDNVDGERPRRLRDGSRTFQEGRCIHRLHGGEVAILGAEEQV